MTWGENEAKNILLITLVVLCVVLAYYIGYEQGYEAAYDTVVASFKGCVRFLTP